MEEKVREIFNSHESEDVKIKRLAALMEQGCEGCSYKRSQLDGLISVQCLGCSYNYPSHYTPTEPKE